MITLTKEGAYSMVSTKDHRMLVSLDGEQYLRSYAPKIGEMLTFAKRTHTPAYTIAQGRYRLYQVKDEPDLVDLVHLELSLGRGRWQGYLLLTGLPTATKIRSRIVPTTEVISNRKSMNTS